MNKRGYVFIETVIVLIIVCLAIVMIFSSYSLLTRKTTEKYYYNLPKDIYFLYTVSTIGTTYENNYMSQNAFYTNKSLCTSSIMNNYLSDCQTMMSNFKMETFGTIFDITTELNNGASSDKYDNGMIDFLKTLKTCNTTLNGDGSCDSLSTIKYYIGSFKRNGKYYYAALAANEE